MRLWVVTSLHLFSRSISVAEQNRCLCYVQPRLSLYVWKQKSPFVHWADVDFVFQQLTHTPIKFSQPITRAYPTWGWQGGVKGWIATLDFGASRLHLSLLQRERKCHFSFRCRLFLFCSQQSSLCTYTLPNSPSLFLWFGFMLGVFKSASAPHYRIHALKFLGAYFPWVAASRTSYFVW